MEGNRLCRAVEMQDHTPQLEENVYLDPELNFGSLLSPSNWGRLNRGCDPATKTTWSIL